LTEADFAVFIGRVEQLMAELNRAEDGGLALRSEYLAAVARKR
jgi:hypothetical protein